MTSCPFLVNPLFVLKVAEDSTDGEKKQLLHFPLHLFSEMSFRNSWKWHLQDPKFQNLEQTPIVWSTFGS